MYNIKLESNILIPKHETDDYLNAINTEQLAFNEFYNNELMEFFNVGLEYDEKEVYLESARDFIDKISKQMKIFVNKILEFIRKWFKKISNFLYGGKNRMVVSRIKEILDNKNQVKLDDIVIRLDNRCDEDLIYNYTVFYHQYLTIPFTDRLLYSKFSTYLIFLLTGNLSNSEENNFKDLTPPKDFIDSLMKRTIYHFIGIFDIRAIYDRYNSLDEELEKFKRVINEYIDPFTEAVELSKKNYPQAYIKYSQVIQKHLNTVMEYIKYTTLAVEKIASDSIYVFKRYITLYDQVLLRED